MADYEKTKIKGVFVRKGKRDNTYYIRYRNGDKTINERVGSEIKEKTTIDQAYELLKKRTALNSENINVVKTQIKRKANVTFSFLKDRYFEELKKNAALEEHLEKKDKVFKLPENIKREESLYKSIWSGWTLRKQPLKNIKEDHVKDWLFKKANEGYGQKYLYNALTLANSIIKHTQEFNDNKHNPFKLEKTDIAIQKKLSKPVHNNRKSFLTEEECNTLLSYLFENSTFQNYAMVKTSLLTGARPDSVLHLKVKDLDFDNNLISFYDYKRKMIYKSNMTPDLATTLKEQVKDRKRLQYVFYSNFTEKKGGLIPLSEYPNSISNVLNTLFNIHKDEDEERIVPYTFRHTFANILLQIHKVPIFDVSKMLNHASIDTTIKNYITYDPKHVLSSLNVFESSLIHKKKNKTFEEYLLDLNKVNTKEDLEIIKDNLRRLYTQK